MSRTEQRNRETSGGNKSVPATRKDVREWLTSDTMKEQFALALPSILTPQRFMRVALTAMNKTPRLLECTQDSVFACLMDCAALGIEPDGRRAHLIPFRDKERKVVTCTLIIDYKGYMELARRSGELAVWRAELVCEEDTFEYDRGSVTKHSINFRKPRGEVYAVYSYARFKDGAEDYEVMTVEEIKAIRKRSKMPDHGPWVTDWREMAKKTTIRRHAKRLPLSAEFRDAVDVDADRIDLPESAISALPGIESPRRISDAEDDTPEPAEPTEAEQATAIFKAANRVAKAAGFDKAHCKKIADSLKLDAKTLRETVDGATVYREAIDTEIRERVEAKARG